jgi:hypothetical protein
MGSLGLAGHRPRHVQDLVALQVAGVGVRGLAGPHGLGATYTGPSGGGSGSVYGSSGSDFDWGGFGEFIGAATTGAASIITAAKDEADSPGSTSAPLYQPQYQYTPPPPPPARSGADLSAVLPFAALVIGGVLGALVTRAL